MRHIRFGGSDHEYVNVAVQAYERSRTGDRYDDNWVAVEVTLDAGGFHGGFGATFLTEEIVRFREEVNALYASLSGWARFHTLEEQLTLALFGNGLGSIELTGTAVDRAGDGNQLQFRFSLDQIYLSEALRGLDEVIHAYPVRA